MTDEQIIEMAKQAGLHVATDVNWIPVIGLAYAKKLVEVATQHERERIFGELLKMHEIASSQHNYYLHAVLTIRARGEA